MDKKKYDHEKQRYEREIEEILSKYDLENERKEKPRLPTIPPGGFQSRKASPSSKSPLPRNWRRISSGQFIAAAFAVAFLAVLVRSISPLVASLLILAAVVLFFMPLVLFRSTGTTSGGWSSEEQHRWRGQVIDFNTRRDITNDPIESIKRWFKRR